MKRDLKWLKERVLGASVYTGQDVIKGEEWTVGKNKVIDLIDQVEQPEITTEQALNKLAEKYPFSSASISAILEGHAKHGRYESELPELPAIPDYVAEWIDTNKEKYDLVQLFWEIGEGGLVNLDVDRWIEENPNTFARAWLDGFTVEEEQKYYVINNDHRMMLVRMMDGKTITEADPFPFGELYDVEKKSHRLTEQEIKDYDPRYMTFAVSVEELDE